MGSRGAVPAAFGMGNGPGAEGMAAVICGASAWSYHTTPPLLREAVLPPETSSLPGIRANAREADARIHARLLTDLKGVPLPLEIMVGRGSARGGSQLTRIHDLPAWLSDEHLIPLGCGLAVTDPLATLMTLAAELSVPELCLRMMEAMGTYAIHAETGRSRAALTCLLASGEVSQEAQRARPDHIRAFRDSDGRRVSMMGRGGGPIPWELSFDRAGRPTNLWRRPPLVTIEDLRIFASKAAGKRGAAAFRRAAGSVCDGAASVLEAKALLLMCADPWIGGEGLPWPAVNQRIELTEEARSLAGTTYCVGDQLWMEQRLVAEVNGKAYHADERGFALVSGRTAALQSMGYQVVDINYDQLADLEKFDAMLKVITTRLGIRAHRRTAVFLRRRDDLHRILFPRGRRNG